MLEFSAEMEPLLKKLSARLLENKWKLVTAESCTGGGLAYYLTELPGSSAWFERGFVTYSNEAKAELLEVPKKTIDTYGAVSEETAKAMAQGALKHSHGQVAISITGIAGPDGGSKEKPIGMVCFACAFGAQVWTETAYFSGDRDKIRYEAIVKAMNLVVRNSIFFL